MVRPEVPVFPALPARTPLPLLPLITLAQTETMDSALTPSQKMPLFELSAKSPLRASTDEFDLACKPLPHSTNELRSIVTLTAGLTALVAAIPSPVQFLTTESLTKTVAWKA